MDKIKNQSLAVKDLKALQKGDWVWLIIVEGNPYEAHSLQKLYGRVIATYGDCFEVGVMDMSIGNLKILPYSRYNTHWFAFKNKESENANYGNVKQAQIEILQKLKEKLTDFANGNNEEEVLSKIEACMDVENWIDELIKELNGKGDQNQ